VIVSLGRLPARDGAAPVGAGGAGSRHVTWCRPCWSARLDGFASLACLGLASPSPRAGDPPAREPVRLIFQLFIFS
jgi:hypothetical protein